MKRGSHFYCAVVLAVAVSGCGGADGPPDSNFEIPAPEVQTANDVRGQLEGIEQGTDLASVGQGLVESLEGVTESAGAAGHVETYQKILEAAQQLADGDKSKFEELKKLADTLPK